MDLANFNSLLFFHIFLRAVAAYVEPPTNVTLHCRNLTYRVEWSYGQSVPGLRFLVNTLGRSSVPSKIWVDPPASHTPDQFLSNLYDAYYLTVTAVVGENKSEPAPPPDGITFSYFMSEPGAQKCFLDLPPVNVTPHHDGHVQFSFIHPWLLYNTKFPSSQRTKTRTKKSYNVHVTEPLPEFTYDGVIINEMKPSQDFTCETKVCEAKLAVEPADKYCLRIKGTLERMLVKAKQDYCTLELTTPTPSNNIHIYIIVAIILVLSGALVLFLVFRKLTKPTTSLPDSVTITSRLKQWTLGGVPEPVIVPEIEPTSPHPLLPEEPQEKAEDPFIFTSTEPEGRLPIGVSIEDEGVCDVGDVKNDQGPGYMQGSNLEEKVPEALNEFTSGYEKRPVLVELAPDEKATGYRC